MKDNYFNVLRSGVNTTFQDLGFKNYQHLGISTGGAVDNNLFNLANKLLDNKIDTPILEFTNRGPLLYLKKGKYKRMQMLISDSPIVCIHVCVCICI